MDLGLTGKTAIVTGASCGIGKAIARVLADEGVDVALIASASAALDEAAAEIGRATGRTVVAMPADTGEDAQVRAAVDRVARTFGHIGEYGITANVVHPFAVRTERSMAQIRELAERDEIALEAAEQRRLGGGNLLRRPIDATEIGFVVAFLASPKGVAVNGEAISVSGGMPGWITY